jgi:hypothetical protein
MRIPHSGLAVARCGLAALLLVCAGLAAAQNTLSWGIEERASQGCVEQVALEFDAAGVLGGHGPRTLCGVTPVRLYPEPLPTGTLSVFWRDRLGQAHRYDVPLDTVFRRENLRMDGTVLELVYGQDSLELWARPLRIPGSIASETPLQGAGAAARQRIYFGGLQVLPGKPVEPGIHRSR